MRINLWYREDPYKLMEKGHMVDVTKYHRVAAQVQRKRGAKEETNPEKIDLTNFGKELLKKLSTHADHDTTDFSFLDFYAENNVPMSELDMMITQYAFCGTIFLRPHKYGISMEDADDIEGFLHVWRVFGYILGMSDKFNLCSGGLENALEHFRNLDRLVVRPSTLRFDVNSLHLSQVYARGLFLDPDVVLVHSLNAQCNVVVEGLPLFKDLVLRVCMAVCESSKLAFLRRLLSMLMIVIMESLVWLLGLS